MQLRNIGLALALVVGLANSTADSANMSNSSASQEAAPVREDCIKYDPSTAVITDEGERGWLISTSEARMVVLDTKSDAERALAIVKAHSAQCFIGRNNKRRAYSSYVFHYWK